MLANLKFRAAVLRRRFSVFALLAMPERPSKTYATHIALTEKKFQGAEKLGQIRATLSFRLAQTGTKRGTHAAAAPLRG